MRESFWLPHAATCRNLNCLRFRDAHDLSATLNFPLEAPLAFFWQIQLAGWIGFAVLSMPLKQAVYGSLHAALLFTAYQLPLAILLTTGLREIYRWAQPDQIGRAHV